MKQIYDFELHNPPILNENIIRNKMELHKLRWQTVWIMLASILVQISLIMLGFFTLKEYPVVTYLCTLYVILSTTIGSVFAIIYTRKKGESL